jgi:hypothetical protein
LAEGDTQGTGVERVLFGPAQQAGPEGDLPGRHGEVLGHLGDGDVLDGVAEVWISLEIRERCVHIARRLVRHI